jgi:hypothetical protein
MYTNNLPLPLLGKEGSHSAFPLLTKEGIRGRSLKRTANLRRSEHV